MLMGTFFDLDNHICMACIGVRAEESAIFQFVTSSAPEFTRTQLHNSGRSRAMLRQREQISDILQQAFSSSGPMHSEKVILSSSFGSLSIGAMMNA
jgi:hypothetical protein